MKRLLLALPIMLISLSAAAQAVDCSSVKSDKARLACYDKTATAKQAAIPAEETAPKGPKQFRSHSWFVDEAIDSMTDKKKCTALYKNQWNIQGVASNLYISFKGRGGVQSYSIRIDDAPADSMQLATDMEKQMSVVILGSKFDRVYDAKRLRVEVLTLIRGLIVEDIDLAGFKDAVDYIRSSCQS